jgi:membrane associated rhomboid family serine protease
MGLSSRDYYREVTPSHWGWDGAPVVKYLIILNVIVFLLQIFVVQPPRITPEEFAERIAKRDQPLSQKELHELARSMQRVSIVQDWLELDTDKVVNDGQVWRLLTHSFCHARQMLFHILFNMLFLYWFGRTLESMYGSREFLLFYLTAAVVAGLAFVGLDLYTGSRVPAVGASGAVLAVTMLYTMHFPRETFCVFWFIQLEMRWLMALYVLWDLHPVLLALSGDPMYSGVAHAAHLGGLAFGFLYAHYEWRIENLAEWIPLVGWKRKAVRVQPSRPTGTCPTRSDASEAEVLDRVLEKISTSGKDSLTDEERDILRVASEKLKTRSGR